MNSNVLSNKKYVTELDEKLRHLSVKLNVMNSVEVDIQSCIKIMKECKTDAETYQKEYENGVLLRETIESNQITLRDLSVKKQQASRQLGSCQDRINRLVKHQTAKKAAVDAGIELLAQEYADVCAEREHVLALVAEDSAQVLALESQVAEMTKRVEAEKALAYENIRVLMESMEAYQATVEVAFKG